MTNNSGTTSTILKKKMLSKFKKVICCIDKVAKRYMKPGRILPFFPAV